MITWQELRTLVQMAEKRFEPVKKKYQDLKPYLVFCSQKGQAGIDSSPEHILQEFHDMVVNNRAKHRVLASIAKSKRWEYERISQSAMNRERQWLEWFIPHLRYKTFVNIEVRFGKLKYDLIRQLQVDPLIDTKNTWPHGASIRVVLTNLAKLMLEMNQIRAVDQVKVNNLQFKNSKKGGLNECLADSGGG